MDDFGNSTWLIDDPIRATWKKEFFTPSEPVGDHEFLRRASLDLIGRIATPAEIEQFLEAPAKERRGRLVDRLLDSPEFADYWGTLWADLLLGPPPPPRVRVHEGRDGFVTYLTLPSEEPDDLRPRFRTWLIEQFRTKQSWDRIVTNLLTAQGTHRDNPEVGFLLVNLGDEVSEHKQPDDGQHDMVPATKQCLRLFLGLRREAKEWPHRDRARNRWIEFWGVNCFFRQVERRQRGEGKELVLEITDNPQLNPRNMLLFENDNGLALGTRSKFIDGRKWDRRGKESRRETLARFVVTHGNFPAAFVNRTWGRLFGRGLHKWPEVDDFLEDHEPRHPLVLERLTQAFKGSGFNVRQLIRSIMLSDVYQLSAAANQTNTSPSEENSFSRMPLKVLDGYQLAASLWTGTHPFPDKDARKAASAARQWHERVRPQLELADPSLPLMWPQVFLMMHDEELNGLIEKCIDDLWRESKPTEMEGVLKQLFLQTLNRPPTEEETAQARQDLRPVLVRNRPLGEAFWKAASVDLLWALLNSNEFQINH